MKTLAFGQIFVRNLDDSEVWKGIERVMARDGYVTISKEKIPQRFLAYKGEIVRVAVSVPGPHQTRAVLFEDWERVFMRALALSREWKDMPVVALLRPPLEEIRAKVYQNGEAILKIGEDEDEEFLYRLAVSSSHKVQDFLRTWWPDDAKDLFLALGSLRCECNYAEAVSGCWPYALEEKCFIERRSRLYLES